MKQMFIVDGRNLLWRAAYVFPNLRVGKLWVGAVYGFLTTILSAHKHYGGTTVIAWEGPINFRKTLFADYKFKVLDKAGLKLYKDVLAQEKIVHKIMQYAGVKQYRPTDGEADDVMGTLASKIHKGSPSIQIFIYSGDSDLRQLVEDNVTVIAPSPFGSSKLYDYDAVVKKFGVTPKQIPLLKALTGDHSDGIPGIRGIGPKYAQQIIKEYPASNMIIDGAFGVNWKGPPRFQTILQSQKKDLLLFEDLALIRRDRKLLLTKPKPNIKILGKLFAEYRFRSLIPKKEEFLKLATGE